jgi:GrpB-like predicted nucleotidyltransferase (UPF0157 family)/RimJ/RimL family protein N-acetyltransferase
MTTREKPVEVVTYDPQWTTRFRVEADRLRTLFGPEALAIHHIGSTAVPGITAKPIIDILLEVRDIDRIDDYNGRMRALGYDPRGSYGLPRRRYFPRVENGIHTFHVHAWQHADVEIPRHLAFRDYMIAHPEEALAYGRLKQELVEHSAGDREQYSAGKNAYCQEIQQRALAWRTAIRGAALQTERIQLLPLNAAELWQYLSRPSQLEAALGLRLSRAILTETVINATRTKLHYLTGADLTRLLWQTYWLMIIEDGTFGVGFIGFKGSPDATGAVEIGYGVDAEVRNQGYTTEAAHALVAWALRQPGVTAVTAWTRQDNLASARVLEKLGMNLVRAEKDTLAWRINRPSRSSSQHL